MADATFRCTNFRAMREACAPMVAAIAAEIAAAAAGSTPVGATGTLAGSYSSRPGDTDPGTAIAVAGPVYYGKYVEYGTRRVSARAPMGRAIASARARYGSK